MDPKDIFFVGVWGRGRSRPDPGARITSPRMDTSVYHGRVVPSDTGEEGLT